MLSSAPLCKCICGSPNRGDPLDYTADCLDEAQDSALEKATSVTHRGLLSYYDGHDQPMRGSPIREGSMCILSEGSQVEAIRLSLYVGGLAFRHRDRDVSLSFSPFSLVRNCKISTCMEGMSSLRCFKVSMFTQGVCCVFGLHSEAKADESEDERHQWVTDVSRAIRLVSQSLFPMHTIACYPVEGAPLTERRLMAGYLIHHDSSLVASVLYSELHPQNDEGTAKLVLYEDETCQVLLTEIYLTENSGVSERVGINCTCFCVEDHQFSSRTLSERRLWLRAISNLKVKMSNRAPSPTFEELGFYRLAIQEHVRADAADSQPQVLMDPLLQRLQGSGGESALAMPSISRGAPKHDWGLEAKLPDVGKEDAYDPSRSTTL